MHTKEKVIEDEILNVKEAAAFLKVKVDTIYAWVHQRKIPFRKHGSRLVFCKRELEAWSQSQAVCPLGSPGLNEIPTKGTRKDGLPPPPESGAEEDCSFKTRRIVDRDPTSKSRR